jgi:hypothetical protein
MSLQSFETVVMSGDRGRVFINLPFTPQDVWGKNIRYVKGTLNQTEFHASIGVRGGQYYMPLNKELQSQFHLKPGDSVSVTMEPDEAQAEALPDDFEQAIQQDAAAQEFFSSLTVFQRNTYVEWVTGAKKAETRAARIQESLERLKSGQKQA